MAAAEVFVRTSESARFRLVERIRAVLGYREVLVNLTRKELKVKYKSTVLGVVWSMLNPLLYLVVFYVVFEVFLENSIPHFAVYLMSGLLGYTLFATALQGSTGSVVANGALVTKVAFAREILPLSAIGASLVNFFWQFVVLLVFMIASTYPFLGVNLLLLPAALAVLLLFVAALGMATAAINVRYRDTQHLIDLALVAWFWVTPIVYPAGPVLAKMGDVASQIYLANPVTIVTMSFQRALYGSRATETASDVLPREVEAGLNVLPDPGLAWYGYRLGIVAAASAILLYIAWRKFFSLSADFAEEL